MSNQREIDDGQHDTSRMAEGDADSSSTPASQRRSVEDDAGHDDVGLTSSGNSLRQVPGWMWLVGSFVALVLLASVLFSLLAREPGFTLVVRGAAQGSTVFVDRVRRGVSAADGTIRVEGLKAKEHLVRVSHESYPDFNKSVSGQDGEVREVVAQVATNQIEYHGTMMLIPAGEFEMGYNQPPNEQPAHPEEEPAHKVTLPDFYIDKFEVTNKQYKEFCDQMRGGQYPSNPWWDQDYFNSKQEWPVVGVSWNDAAAYADWAGKKRLPTEAEWEKAASWDASTQRKRRWPWGDEPVAQGHANLATDNSAKQGHTTKVGEMPDSASAYGVQDMAGNVLEWVMDYYLPYEGNTHPDPKFGKPNLVLRGGHFASNLDDARTTRRIYWEPKFSAAKFNQSRIIGFRCAISAKDLKLQEQPAARGQ